MMHSRLKFLFVPGLALILTVTGNSAPAVGEDWAGWMGSNRDGVYRESGIVQEIPSSGLDVKWRKPVAGGYAGPAVAGGRVFLFDYLKESGSPFNDPGKRVDLDGKERLTVFDAASGSQIWQHEYPCSYSISYPSGPRCTPTVDGDRVYILGSEGDLKCLNASSGDEVWARNLKSDFSVKSPLWGFSAHPLVDEKLLYTMVGGDGQGVVAFDKMTGEVKWKALDCQAGYCPPQLMTAGGKQQLIIFHPAGVQGLNPENGESYWDIPMKPSYEMSISAPVRYKNLLYVSSIHTEACLIELDESAPKAKELWRGESKNAVHCSNAPAAFVDGVIYGTDCLQGTLIAVDSKDGSRLWETFAATKPDEKRFIKHGTAFITRMGESNRYLLMSENGDLIIAELTRDNYKEKGRFHLVDPSNESFGRPVVWTYPAYANKTVFMRNDKEIVAVSLAK